MSLAESFQYPWNKDNVINLIVIPTLLFLVLGVVSFAPMLVMLVATGGLSQGGNPFDNLSLFGLGGIAAIWAFVGLIVMNSLYYGYFWNLVAIWQTKGLSEPAPSWFSDLSNYLMSGLHGTVLSFILVIPVIISVLTLGFLVPFLVVPWYQSAQERTVGAYFRAFGPSFAQVSENYWPILGQMWLIFIIYMVIVVITGFIPFVGFLGQQVMIVIMMHYLTMVFLSPSGEQPTGMFRPNH